jgi:hypothetical protein
MSPVRSVTYVSGPDPEEQEKARDFEPQTHREMILKLLDHEIRCLTAGTRDTEQVLTSGASGQQQDRLDLYLRYHTSARREFYRALKAYREEQVRMKSPSLRQRSKS